MAEPAQRGEAFPEVLAEAKAGADWAVATLFTDHQPALLRYLAARVPWAADDVASQVWLEVARGLTRFEGDEPGFRGWLFVIARRRAANERRRVARARVDPGEQDLAVSPAGDDPAGEAIDRLAGDEAARLVVGLLPELQAEVVLLRVISGFTVEETASMLGRRPGNVRVLQHRALRTLAKKLDGCVTQDGVAGMWGVR